MELKSLGVKLFADGANLEEMVHLSKNDFIKGLTTNPSLVRNAGVTDYEKFARETLEKIQNIPISFEVLSDDFEEMITQGKKIASWGSNVYVKVPITNTKGVYSTRTVKSLTDQGVKVNVTAITTISQVEHILDSLNSDVPSFISVFAGRIADTGVNPLPVMSQALEVLNSNANTELIWASPRELLNIIQADQIGCDIITATSNILNKLHLLNHDLTLYSLETVKMFINDAKDSGFQIS